MMLVVVHKLLICLLQLSGHDCASHGQGSVQSPFNARAEEEVEGLPPVNAGVSGPTDQKTPRVCPLIQLTV